MRGNFAELGAGGEKKPWYVEFPELQNNRVFLRPLNTSSSVGFFFFLPPSSTIPPLEPEPVVLATVSGPSSGPSAAEGRPARLGTMKLAALLGLCCLLRLSDCAPPTCYSRALSLSKEVMTLLDKVHTSERTVSTHRARARAHSHTRIMCFTRSVLLAHFQKTCADVLPTIFLDVHVSQNTRGVDDFARNKH